MIDFIEIIALTILDFLVAIGVYGFFIKGIKKEQKNLMHDLAVMKNPEQFETCLKCGLSLQDHTIAMAKEHGLKLFEKELQKPKRKMKK